ncbi:nuclear transport factor 2 family protein [Shewanella sp. cp20]|uniref:nuclear transport factor 2 family protein n=1 Tax=Shewanella sp. cp20 TaxID=1521167 RepID=UPI0005ADD9B5|nr:nuclear transport factor 2 family protein [Shewanella sp. cp20]KIO37289.1 polyketide cyclase [Shewanella sp. cp20]
MKLTQMIMTSLMLLAASVIAKPSLGHPKPQTPDELHTLFAQYFKQKNLEGLSTLFAADAKLILDNKGRAAMGREAIVGELEKYLQVEGEMITLSKSVHINGEIALIRTEWQISGTDLKGTALEVMQYKDNGWLYIIDNPNGY